LKGRRDIPFILVSGILGEEVAVEVDSWAHDYVLKSHSSV
jgi:hypothetical protein